MAKDKIAMRWKGNGFYVGVPARDLSAEEVKRYGGRERLLALGLYEEIEQPKPKAKVVNKAMIPPPEDEWHEEDVLWIDKDAIDPPEDKEPEAEEQPTHTKED